MTIHLPDDLESVVRTAVLHGEFPSEDDMVAAILREYVHRRQQQASNPAAPVPGRNNGSARQPKASMGASRRIAEKHSGGRMGEAAGRWSPPA